MAVLGTLCYLALVSLVSVTSVEAECPHDNGTLTRWSDPTTWPTNKLPEASATVSITGHVLLDVSPPALFGIVVEAGAILVWSPEGDFHVSTNYIHVKGAFHIGSETCPFEENARITLTGTRKEYSMPNFGQKFIGVDAGGTLEIHGKKKLAWTKLTKSLPRLQAGNGLLYTHLDFPNSRQRKGLGMIVFNTDGSHYKTAVFTTTGPNQADVLAGIQYLLKWLPSIPAGKVILLAVQHTLVSDTQVDDLASVYDAIETAAGISSGQGQIRKVGMYDAFAMAFIKGDPSSTVETLTPVEYHYQKAEASLKVNDLIMVAESCTNTGSRISHAIDFRVVKETSAFHVLEVVDDVTSWKEGDTILLTSTDFSLDKSEIATVVSCGDCAATQVKVALLPRYMHYGDIDFNVDMRGEVALLSRNILIEGAMDSFCPKENENCDTYKYDTFGGHVKVIKGFKDVHIEGVELYHMGKQTDLGHYPLHFHMCYDVDGAEYPNPPYLRENSIHSSFARCVTVHGTHGLTVMDNVGYESLGHCYFLEDGGERRTVLDGNLGASTRKATLISSDSRPTTFWITNPNTILRNNVAAGSEDIGYWFIYPDTPTGPSADKGFMQYQEARYTAITECSNNGAHSNKFTGFFIDFQIHPTTGDIWITSNRYSPKVDPLDPKSADKPAIIDRLTSYKNRNNVWARGGYLVFRRTSLADATRGITFARGTYQQQFLEKSVILGQTNNLGDPMRARGIDGSFVSFDRSLPYQWNFNEPMQGFNFYDGPVFVSSTFFNGFISNQYRKAGAIGFLRNNKFFSSASSAAKDLHFGFQDGELTGNRVYDGNSSIPGFDDLDGDIEAVFRDADGSVTTVPGSSVVRSDQFLTTSDCSFRPNWNLAICPFKYMKMQVVPRSAGDLNSVPFVSRDDIPDSPRKIDGTKVVHFSLITGGQFSYSLHWPDVVPAEFLVRAWGLEKDYPVRVGLCLPLDATFSLKSYYPKRALTLDSWTEVNSVHEIDQDTEGGKYYHNKATGMLYVMLRSLEAVEDGDTATCVGDKCVSLLVYVTGGDRNDGDCSARDTPTPPSQVTHAPKAVADGSLSFDTSYSGPETDWGAGGQIPFSSRMPQNGGYSGWTEWSACKVPACAGSVMVRFRTRTCDQPIPRNGGAPCQGPSSEEMDCTTK
ncbi:transmembrane protein 2-like [Mizuhopecten yessoensis]|uniref:Transmembrane protein 2 n=1 Tax=Mizuhopecten yessoensis TaxID=6573 RepID=A0A210QS32_MIZYE|nr:transmembrane protein 2-like [Mizuhopecten yessoensis]OWF51488.1 Transmembrane protein 2 [Mizuhopecten yessoensis]